jgi:hypothetical protein
MRAVYLNRIHDDSVAPSSIFNNVSGPPMIESEIIYAFSTSKNRKALEKDDEYVEVNSLKLVNTRKLCQLFNVIYDSGNIPGNWLTSIFAAIPKKSNAKACEEQLPISLMSHALKIFQDDL